MRRAFTLIELVVAVAILAMVISFSAVVFKVSIKAQRIASANMEIMQKMRAITDQLNADLKGHIGNPRGKIRFEREAESYKDNKVYYTGGEGVNNNIGSDSILFFATGDFQSTGQYLYNDPSSSGPQTKTVTGTAACIYYGLADVTSYKPEERPDPKKKVLVRRQTIITGDVNWDNVTNYKLNDLKEYCEESLAYLIANLTLDDVNALMAEIEDKELDLDDANDLSVYMARGVDDFTIQYVGDEIQTESMEFNEWRPDDENFEDWNDKTIRPIALKFSFTIYDSRAIIEKGRRFTHIVYLAD